MRKISIAVVMVLGFGVSSAMAQTQRQQPPQLPNPFQALFSGTPQEQAACAPDSDKFCKAMGNDELRVLGCLQRNRQQISVACRRVLESHGQ